MSRQELPGDAGFAAILSRDPSSGKQNRSVLPNAGNHLQSRWGGRIELFVAQARCRIETRQTTIITQQEDDIDSLRYERNSRGHIQRERWVDLSTIVRVTSERWVGENLSQETRYFTSSLSAEASRLGDIVRGHWGIENQLHWVLDVASREDDSRMRRRDSAHNFATLRRLALCLLRSETSVKCGIKNRRLKAGWDDQYMLKLLRC